MPDKFFIPQNASIEQALQLRLMFYLASDPETRLRILYEEGILQTEIDQLQQLSEKDRNARYQEFVRVAEVSPMGGMQMKYMFLASMTDAELQEATQLLAEIRARRSGFISSEEQLPVVERLVDRIVEASKTGIPKQEYVYTILLREYSAMFHNLYYVHVGADAGDWEKLIVLLLSATRQEIDQIWTTIHNAEQAFRKTGGFIEP